MKKFFAILMAIFLAAMVFTSCKDYDPKIDYDVSMAGDADGDVNVKFPGGTFDLRGTAGLDFHYGKVDTLLLGMPVYTFADTENDPQVLKAYKAVKEDYEKQFGVTAATGTYYFHIFGYATAYGLKIQIDETFTNRQTANITNNPNMVPDNVVTYLAHNSNRSNNEQGHSNYSARFDYMGY